MAKKFENLGGKIFINESVEKFVYNQDKIEAIYTKDKVFYASDIISTMPVIIQSQLQFCRCGSKSGYIHPFIYGRGEYNYRI